MSLVLGCLLLLPEAARPFSLLGPATPEEGGNPEAANHQLFDHEFRWSVSTLTYSIDQSFADRFGASGVAALQNALSTWDNAFGAASPGSIASVFTGSGLYDLESIAVHELGHAFGLGHSDLADDFGRNYDATGTPIAATGNEVMSSTLAAGEVRRALTADDLAGFNYLYDPANVNSAMGVDLGAGVGDLSLIEAPGSALLGVTQGANIDIFALDGSDPIFAGTNALAVTQVNFVFLRGTDGPGIINTVASLGTVVAGVDVYFNSSQGLGVVCDSLSLCGGSSPDPAAAPEPGTWLLLLLGFAGTVGMSRLLKPKTA